MNPCTLGPAGQPCGRFQPGEDYAEGECRQCWLWANSDEYRRHWQGKPPKKRRIDPNKPRMDKGARKD
jgi:hypothetical protein